MNRCKVCQAEFQSSDPDDQICPACEDYLETIVDAAELPYLDFRSSGESFRAYAERRMEKR
jgi:hypothetical protein